MTAENQESKPKVFRLSPRFVFRTPEDLQRWEAGQVFSRAVGLVTKYPDISAEILKWELRGEKVISKEFMEEAIKGRLAQLEQRRSEGKHVNADYHTQNDRAASLLREAYGLETPQQ